MDELSTFMDESRAKNYDKNKFEKLFSEFDEDNDGFLSKSEMAVFIKRVFKKSESAKKAEQAKSKGMN